MKIVHTGTHTDKSSLGQIHMYWHTHTHTHTMARWDNPRAFQETAVNGD